MNSKLNFCPVCCSPAAGEHRLESWGGRVTCNVCGRFDITREAFEDELDPENSMTQSRQWTKVKRAALSHALRTQKEVPLGEAGYPKLTTENLEKVRKSVTLPNKLQQASNIIQYIGNYEQVEGRKLPQAPEEFYAVIGSVDQESAIQLALELHSRGLIQLTDVSNLGGPEFRDASLTLDGWEHWNKERSKQNTSSTGIIAMQFGDKKLDAIVENTIKPAVATIPGLSIERIDDSPKAGVIDMILRQAIRDSAFVIADLSHANNGAYWEAGFAEGLGKPVIYICEEGRWHENKTHFDTNHCTTVIYDNSDLEKFKNDLVATIRNSLNLFTS